MHAASEEHLRCSSALGLGSALHEYMRALGTVLTLAVSLLKEDVSGRRKGEGKVSYKPTDRTPFLCSSFLVSTKMEHGLHF